MKFQLLSLLPYGLLVSAASIAMREEDARVRSSCKTLQSKLRRKVFLPGSPVYEEQGALYYSLIAADQRPSCRVAPQSAEDVSLILKILKKENTKFAVRSGGHNPWGSMSNIDSPGVTIDMTGLASTTVTDTENGPVAHVGPGARWGAVYDTLDTFNLTAVGGRATTVGVGGFLLGGGISWFNAQVGLAAQNILNYEIVLADGSIANVNASSYPDLHTALNGGNTNFGIVTRYDLITYPLVPMWGGFRNYELSQQAALINGTITMMHKQVEDTRVGGAVFSYSRPFNTSDVILAMLAAYFNGDGPLTDAFDEINAVPFIGDDLFATNTNQQALAGQVDSRFEGGSRAMFSTLTFEADTQFPQDVFNKAAELLAPFDDNTKISWAVSFQANGRAVWDRVAQIPNFQNVETGRDFLVFVLVSYSLDASLDDALVQWHHDVIDWMTQEAQSRGLLTRWLYLNYARPDQEVYQSWGEDNHRALKRIRRKYDPTNVFGRLWPGGYKI